MNKQALRPCWVRLHDGRCIRTTNRHAVWLVLRDRGSLLKRSPSDVDADELLEAA